MRNTSISTDPRPNFVVVLADQWAAASLGAFGCEVPEVSPNLDALAASGIAYRRHYTPIPICGPSRNALLNGRSPMMSGMVANDVEPRPDSPFFTRDLRDAGYRTVGVGKFHFTPHTNYPPAELDHLGFDHVEVTEDTRHGAWLDWIAAEHPDYYEQALATAWPMPYLDSVPPNGRDLTQTWRTAYEKHVAPLIREPYRRIFRPSPLPADLQQTTWIADRAIANLDEIARTDDPFLLYVSFVDPHDPYDPPKEWADRFDWREMPAPIPQEWTRETGPWEYAAFQDTKFELPTFDHETWQRLRAAYFASCAFVDHHIGRLLVALRERGLDENTVVVFTTDHGDVIGDHGLLMKGPWHYDKTVRCPMIVAGRNIPEGAVFDGLTSHLDIRPFVLEHALIDPGATEGRALPTAADELRAGIGHARIAIETNTSYVAPADQVRTVITHDGWRLTVFCDQEYGELFDLNSDPDEQVNLYHDPAHRDTRLRLTEELVAAMAGPAVVGRTA